MYELWDLQSGNRIDVFPAEADALAWVRQSAQEDGPEYVQELALLRVDAESGRELTAQGEALVKLACTQTPAA